MNTVSVYEALMNGKRTVIFPAVMVFFAGLALMVYVAMNHHETPWPVIGCFIAALVSGWLYWSIAITFWRIFAFTNVRNVHELKEKAIAFKIIGPDKSFATKTEIRTAAQRRELQKLRRKFEQPDVYHDDLSVPKQTEIGYSKFFLAFGLFLAPSLFIGTGIWILITQHSWISLAVSVPLSAYIFYKSFGRYRVKGAVIRIDSHGIQLQRQPFFSWRDITEATIHFEQHGKHQQHILRIKTHQHNAEVNIGELHINSVKLDHLLRIYRVRFDKLK